MGVIAVSGAAQAAGYVYRAPDGTLEFTDVEKSDPDYQLVRRVDLDDRSSLTIVSELPSWVKRPALYRPIRPSRSPGNRLAYITLIDEVARETGLKPELLHAVIRAESAYDATAVSHAGAGGLMQLMPGTAERYGVRDRFDPRQNALWRADRRSFTAAWFVDVAMGFAGWQDFSARVYVRAVAG